MRTRRSRGGGAPLEVVSVLLLLSLAICLRVLPSDAQAAVATALRATVLLPFLEIRAGIVESSALVEEVETLRRKADSLMSVAAASSVLREEGEALRALLGLEERAPHELAGVTILRAGGSASESMFIVDRGTEDGVLPGAPVITPDGVLGRIVQARGGSAVGIDWTHRDFRVSAMLEDGSAYGIVRAESGGFREEDRLVLDGMPFHVDAPDGRLVLTSGLGSVFPRGIPVGTAAGLRSEQEPWTRSYWLRPAVEPASALYAAVVIGAPGDDLRRLWAPPDAAGDSADAAPPAVDSAPVGEAAGTTAAAMDSAEARVGDSTGTAPPAGEAEIAAATMVSAASTPSAGGLADAEPPPAPVGDGTG